jgi:adenylate cyclase
MAPHLRKYWINAAGFALPWLLAMACFVAPSFQLLESQWRDQQFRLLSTDLPILDNEPVAIVGIDDEDMVQFGVPSTLLHRELGAFMEAMALAHPKVVGLDMLLPAVSFDKLQPGLDAALARGILKLRPVAQLVLGLSADSEGTPRPVHPLFNSLVGTAGFGYIFVISDADGVIRAFDERIGDRGNPVPTLTGQMARAMGAPPTPGLINYAIRPAFQYVPLRKVLAWQREGQVELLHAAFANKAVFLGSVMSFDDHQRTTLALGNWNTPHGTSHGVLVHAQQLRSMMDDAMVQPLAFPYQLLLMALLALGWWLKPGAWTWVGLVVLAIAIQVSSLVLLRSGWAVASLSLCVAWAGGIGSKAAVNGWLLIRERKRLRDTFGGFVSPDVMTEILAGKLDPKMDGVRSEICVLFADIRGFTTLSESMPPEQVTALLNRYFDRMVGTIHSHGGTLDKFIGDGLMAVFGAPVASNTACEDGLACAQAMIRELGRFNAEQLSMDAPAIDIGVGLHYGPAVIGYVGSRDRYEYSAIGDTVNTASRIEGLTKDSGFPVLLSNSVYHHIQDTRALVSMGTMSIRGHSAIAVFAWRPEPGNSHEPA